MRVIFLNGLSHGRILHAVPDLLPDWVSPSNQAYRFHSMLTHQIALYVHGKKSPDKTIVDDWKRLLSDNFLFTGSKSFHRQKRPHQQKLSQI